MSNPKIITFKTSLPAFTFMGIENIVKEDSDFGSFWGNFFGKGGYDPMKPYETDPNCVNVWYNKPNGEKIYYQGKLATSDAKAPDGYTVTDFPSVEFLVATTEWVETYEETMAHIGMLNTYLETAALPEGYVKCRDDETGIFSIERWGANTGEGYRYEVWAAIRRG